METDMLNDWLEKVERWLMWVLVTGISWTVGLVVVSVLMRPAVADLPYRMGLVASLALGGAMVGIIQWLILRPEAENANRWILATAAGWTICLLIGTVMAQVTIPVVAGLAGGAIGGLALGYAQRWAMITGVKARQQWLPMTTGSWMLAFTLGLLIPGDVRSVAVELGFEGVWSAGLLGWAFITLVGGLILILAFPKRDKAPFGDLGDWYPKS
jgi:hypothetical protein